ncbi:MAG TPA: hypothetical protein VJZ27_16990, partial [Aggregatilineales bacterium]|nr:hypothetical protein [Aggregatilineales bacterium]
MGNNGFVRNNINQFAFVYRLADLLIIQATLLGIAVLRNVQYDFMYFALALIANVSFSFFSELFWLYRSWRAAAFQEMIFNTLLSWVLALLPILTFILFNGETSHFPRAVLGIWILAALAGLCGWRTLFRYFLYHLRRRGRNSRSVGIIGLSEPGCKLAQEILEHPEIGYRLKGVFDDRSENSVPDRMDMTFASHIEGNVS